MAEFKWYKVFNNQRIADQTMPVNSTQLIKIKGKRICLSRLLSGYYATDDSCPHLGESLSGGHINNSNQIVCPWHSYRFDLQWGREVENRCGDLPVYPVNVSEKGVFIGMLD